MLNRRRRVHTAWRYAPVVRWRCSSSCCCVLPLAFVGSACTASCSAACSELGAATRLAVTARRLRHERGSKIARPRDAVIIRLADDLGPLNLERDAIAYGPRQGIKCRASPTPIAQTHAPTCMGMAYAPPTERKDAPHSTATGPRGDHKVKYTLQAAAIGGAGALTCSSLGLILHAGHTQHATAHCPVRRARTEECTRARPESGASIAASRSQGKVYFTGRCHRRRRGPHVFESRLNSARRPRSTPRRTALCAAHARRNARTEVCVLPSFRACTVVSALAFCVSTGVDVRTPRRRAV